MTDDYSAIAKEVDRKFIAMRRKDELRAIAIQAKRLAGRAEVIEEPEIVEHLMKAAEAAQEKATQDRKGA